MDFRRFWQAGLFFLCFPVLPGTGAIAAPRVPASDQEILERLPAKPADATFRDLRRLRDAVLSAPQDPVPAGTLARRYFELAMAEGDPRYVGYAEGVLFRWREQPEAPAEILVLQGLLRQYRHDFDGALRQLAAALERDPHRVEAHAWRAAIYMVQAKYDLAMAECAALSGFASELLLTGCRTSVEGVTGRAGQAYEKLKRALDKYPGTAPDLQVWIRTRLAELAQRLGRKAEAERHFRDALALGIADNYLFAAYADFLLEDNRAADALKLLRDRERSDTLLLRIALAERMTKAATGAARERILGERFHDASLRGERLHLAEEARFLLDLRGDPKAALLAAQENWKTQREPRDAEILLEAALASRDPAAAGPVLDWLKATGFEGARLARLAKQLPQAGK